MGGQLGKQPQSPPLGVEGLDCRPQVLYWKPSTCAGEVCQPGSYVGSKTGTWGAFCSVLVRGARLVAAAEVPAGRHAGWPTASAR